MGIDDGGGSEKLGSSGKYCLDCEWSARAGRSNAGDPSEAALEHFLETGHTIESIDRVPPDSFEFP